jgi:hypothetical protein
VDQDKIGQGEAFDEFLAASPDLEAAPLPSYPPEARVFLVTRGAEMVSPRFRVPFTSVLAGPTVAGSVGRAIDLGSSSVTHTKVAVRW